jgi:hypothetical protein
MGKLTNISKRMGGGLLGCVLTDKMRRMILVVSIATYLHTLNSNRECKLGDLNACALLSHNVKALDFPATINIWKGSELENIDLRGGHDSIVAKIMDNIPSYLRYGKNSEMAKDILTAVDFSLAQPVIARRSTDV